MPSTDAWNYAAEIKHSGSFFYPYHLLYNSLGCLFCAVPSVFGAEIISCLKIMNAFFAVMSLMIIQAVVQKLRNDSLLSVLVSALSGSSFGFMRFASENETYIVPLFFALAATWFMILYSFSSERKFAILASACISLSVLFHITYTVWWITLLAGFFILRKYRGVLWYLLLSLIIPAVYLLVILLTKGDLEAGTVKEYMLGDLLRSGGFSITMKGMLFTFINFFRSFLQMHGYIFNMVRSNIIFLLPFVFALTLFVFAFLQIRKEKGSWRKSPYIVIFSVLLILNLVMALLSHGNAEFMVMIPVLTFIIASLVYTKPFKPFLLALTGMIIWNVSYGLYPLSLNSQKTADFLAGKLEQSKKVLVIAYDDQQLESMIYYKTGIRDEKRILRSPANTVLKGYKISTLEVSVDSAISGGAAVYTDCPVRETVSRASISGGKYNQEFFGRYKTEDVFSQELITGSSNVRRLVSKKAE